MFGHQDQHHQDHNDNGAVTSEPQPDGTLSSPAADNATNMALPPAGTPMVGGAAPVASATTAPAVHDTSGDYLMDDAPEHTVPSVNPPAPAAAAAPAPAAPADADELLDIKQNALQQLMPLVDHLDQTPEEKFRTTMMMIQAADNQALLKTAYDTAQQIPDEKARAQALLDVVNEINYFTQHPATDQLDHASEDQ